MLLRVYPHDMDPDALAQSNGLCILDKASDVKVSQEINATPVLTFSMPEDDGKWQHLQQGNFVVCNQQIYRVYKKTRSRDSSASRSVECLHVLADAAQKLILTYPAMIAKTPRQILTEAFKGTSFTLLTTLPNGMQWVTDPTDFLDPQSKVTPLDIAKQLVEKLDQGELYVDNYKIALVKQVISNPAVMRSSTRVNAKSIGDEEDGGGIITRLYPFGKDDLPLAGGSPYIDSPMQAVYGNREGYKEYDEIEDPAELLTKARWEFAEDNPKRIDVPDLSYTLNLVDLSKAYGDRYKIGLGDSIKITDSVLGINTVQRVVKIEFYPFEPKSSSVTLGRPATTFSQAFSSLVNTEGDYKRKQDSSGNIKVEWLENLLSNKSEAITGALRANEVTVHKTGDIWEFASTTGNKAVAIVDGQLAISDTKNADGSWVWTTFVDGRDVSADVLNGGTLNTNLVDLKSADGKTTLRGNEFRLEATDGTTVSIRATDGTNGIQKGFQIVEAWNANGTPKTYSVYNSAGQQRYINNRRIQTYTITAAGNGRTYTYSSGRATLSAVYLPLDGDYFFEWAAAYNSATDVQRRKMLTLMVADNTKVRAYGAYANYDSSYTFDRVQPVHIGDSVAISASSSFASSIDGAYIVYRGNVSYQVQTAPNIWELEYQALELSFMANTTMELL